MKAVFLTLIFALAISIPLSTSVLAQTSTDTPEAVAKAYLAATQAADWSKVASLMHPDAQAQLKKIVEPQIANEKWEKWAETFFGVKSRAEFDQLSGAQVFEKMMSMLGEISKQLGSPPRLDKGIVKEPFHIIGHIAETPDLAHVLLRHQATWNDIQLDPAQDPSEKITFTEVDVITLKRHKNTWLTLNGEDELRDKWAATMVLAIFGFGDIKDRGAPRKAPSTPVEDRKPVRKP